MGRQIVLSIKIIKQRIYKQETTAHKKRKIYMSNLKLITTETFNNLPCNFYVAYIQSLDLQHDF
nr:MAG TPA: hypothetical protein [Bacteriophage sp.]